MKKEEQIKTYRAIFTTLLATFNLVEVVGRKPLPTSIIEMRVLTKIGVQVINRPNPDLEIIRTILKEMEIVMEGVKNEDLPSRNPGD